MADECCELLHQLCEANESDEAAKELLRGCGVIEALVAVLTAPDASQTALCYCVKASNVLCDESEAIERAGEAGVVGAVAAAVRGSTDEDLIKAGGALLSRLVAGDFELAENAAEQGIVDALVLTLRHVGGGWPPYGLPAADVCAPLMQMCDMYDHTAAAACAAGAAEAVVAAMSNCEDDAEALGHCCKVLVSTWCTEEKEGLAGAAGAIEATTMRQWAASTSLPRCCRWRVVRCSPLPTPATRRVRAARAASRRWLRR